jgi:hypothetical protein
MTKLFSASADNEHLQEKRNALVKLVLSVFISLTITCSLCYFIADSATERPSSGKAIAIWSLLLIWFVGNFYQIVYRVKEIKRL